MGVTSAPNVLESCCLQVCNGKKLLILVFGFFVSDVRESTDVRISEVKKLGVCPYKHIVKHRSKKVF